MSEAIKAEVASSGKDGVPVEDPPSKDDEAAMMPSFVVRALEENELTGLSSKEYVAALEEYGYNEVVVEEEPIWMQILSRYLGVVPLFIITTAVLSAAIETTCTEGANPYVRVHDCCV